MNREVAARAIRKPIRMKFPGPGLAWPAIKIIPCVVAGNGREWPPGQKKEDQRIE
jgi:hypothetical protein